MQQINKYPQGGVVNVVNMVFDIYYHNGVFKGICRQIVKKFPQCSLKKNKDGTLRLYIDNLSFLHPAEVRLTLASIPGVVRVDWLEGYFLEELEEI